VYWFIESSQRHTNGALVENETDSRSDPAQDGDAGGEAFKGGSVSASGERGGTVRPTPARFPLTLCAPHGSNRTPRALSLAPHHSSFLCIAIGCGEATKGCPPAI
jgi:hypothetical protein